VAANWLAATPTINSHYRGIDLPALDYSPVFNGASEETEDYSARAESSAPSGALLASDAGSFTGHDLVVDGGWVPSGTMGCKESVAMRAELTRRIWAEVGQNA